MIYWIYVVELFLILGNEVLPIDSQIVFDPKPTNQDATNGRNALLRCGIRGPNSENYTISWVAGGKAIKNNKRRFQEGNNLAFHPINRFIDSDEFQCLATTQEGKVEISPSAQFNIKWIQVGDVALKRPDKPSHILSDMKGSIALNCNITGNPVPNNFVWYVNGTEQGSNNSVQIKSKGKLVINQPRLAVNDGAYSCCARYLGERKCTPKGGEFNLKVTDHRIPRLLKAPSDKVVKKGSSVTLDCVYDAIPPPQIIWRKKVNSKEITNRSNSGQCTRRCVYLNGTLVLHKVKDGAAVEYECLARQGSYVSSPVSASVFLANIEPFSEGHVDKFVSAGRKFEYNCGTPPGRPEPSLTWKRLRDNYVIQTGGGHVTRTQNTLIIDNVAKSDAGTYSCVAQNIAGTVSQNITLAIGSIPQFQHLRRRKTKEGSNFRWTCPVSGNPEPTVTWYKDSSLISSIPGRSEVVAKQLILTNVKLSDAGLYHCAARNELDTNSHKSSDAQLEVAERLKFWPPLRNTTIALGEPIKVNCTVTGSANADVTWERLNASMDSTVTLPRSPNQRSLFFTSPAPSQSGWYQCNASDATARISGQIYINVVRRPRIVVRPHDGVVYAGKAFVFNCNSTPDEKSKATWSFEDQIYIESDSLKNFDQPIVMPNGSLKISVVQSDDAGVYTCTYERDGLLDRASAELTVTDELPPNTPTTVDNTGTQMIQTIALSVSGGIAYVLATAAIIIYCRRKHRKQRTTGDTNHHEAEAMLNGLSNGRSNHHDEVIQVKNGIPLDELATLKSDLSKLDYPTSNINSITVIGKGEFGDVFLSKAPGLFPELDEDILVMVKHFNPSDEKQSRSVTSLRAEFNREINLLHAASHDGIVKLLALSSDSEDGKPNYLLTEYLEWGILKLCLSGSKANKIAKFTKHNKMNMCCQLACGLDHLDKLGLHHNDLATRNCVISFQLLVKISILGLTREGFENEYHLYKGKRLPVRWMAPEALFDGETSSKSVVWSFAVACWEIFTLADMPYESITNDEFVQALQSNNPPTLPPLEGSKRISSLIKKCCQRSPKDRPEIRQIMKKLQSILASGDVPDDKSTEASALLS